jgi:four helix bundle protein
MNAPNESMFDHEKLEVYREAVAFIVWLSALLEGMARLGEVKDQLDRASTSIPLNIAEGNGKYAPKDRCRFFDIAHGSALECAAGLDILVAKGKSAPGQIRPGKERSDAHGLNQKEFNARIRNKDSDFVNPTRTLALSRSSNPSIEVCRDTRLWGADRPRVSKTHPGL